MQFLGIYTLHVSRHLPTPIQGLLNVFKFFILTHLCTPSYGFRVIYTITQEPMKESYEC